MGEIEANDEKLDEALLQFPGAGSSPWGSIWSSSELKSSWTQETPFDAAAEIVRQLVLRQRPELETVLDTVLSDLHGKCPQGHVSEQVEKGSSAMSDRLQELQEQKASLLQHLRDVAEEANSHKSTVLNRLNADGQAIELLEASGIERLKPPSDGKACPFHLPLSLDAGGESRTTVSGAFSNDSGCCCKGNVNGRCTMYFEDSSEFDLQNPSVDVGNSPSSEEECLHEARLRLESLQKQVDHLCELQSQLARTSEGLREALSSLQQEHSSHQSTTLLNHVQVTEDQ